MNTVFPEEWRKIAGFTYEASNLGHIRRRPSGASRGVYIKYYPDTTGRQYVSLRKGKQYEIYVDELICTAFHGVPPDAGMIVEHVDGIVWNNWPSNLRWSYPIMATQWYCGPISWARRGNYRCGPLKTQHDIMPHLRDGDIMIALDDDKKIVAFSFALGRDFDHSFHNPYTVARYWRATVNHLMEIEKLKGADIVVDRSENPFVAAQRYRELAQMHPEYMWARYLLDAAIMIERMADLVYTDVSLPDPVVMEPIARRRTVTIPPPIPPPQTTPTASLPGVARRSIVRPAPVVAPDPPRRHPDRPPAAANDPPRRHPSRTPSAPGFWTKS